MVTRKKKSADERRRHAAGRRAAQEANARASAKRISRMKDESIKAELKAYERAEALKQAKAEIAKMNLGKKKR